MPYSVPSPVNYMSKTNKHKFLLSGTLLVPYPLVVGRGVEWGQIVTNNNVKCSVKEMQ